MKIAIEAQRIMRRNKHGMDFVVLEAIRQLQKIDLINEYFIIVCDGDDVSLQESGNMHIIKLKCPTYPLWEQIALPIVIAKIKPDILHCTSNTAPILCKTPLLLTLHDIIFLERRQSGNRSLYQNMGWYYRRFVVPLILKRCSKIITVSEFEKRRIKERLSISDGKIVAIHNGYSSYFIPVEDSMAVTKRYIDNSSYLFFLGNTDPKKNSERTLKAYAIYLNNSKNPLPLLIADLKWSVIDDILIRNNIEFVREYIVAPGYIPNSDLPYIYSGAKAFLYTSVRESFGIPILEAMACGTPVITSNISAIPEIAGSGAILVDPYNEKEIADMILKIDSDQLFCDSQIEYGLKRVKEFSWQQTAIKLLELYNSL